MKSKGSILVVDDEEDIRILLREMLTHMGYRVTTASDGQEALEVIPQQQFDLILADIQMPRISGLELLNRIRKAFPLLPFVLITGFPSVDLAVEAMKQGASDFIPKPFHFDYVDRVLSRLICERQLLLENRELSKEVEQKERIERLNKDLQKKIEEISALYTISETLNTIDEKQDILGQVVSLATRLSEAEQVTLFLVDPEQQDFTLHLMANTHQKPFGTLTVPEGEAILQLVTQQKQWYGQSIPERQWHPEQDFELGIPPLHSLFFPLLIRENILGVLYLAPKRGGIPYISSDLFLIKTLVEKASLRLENHALYTHLFSQITDTLRVLVSTLEARDRYTRDHSLRVVQYSLAIATELQLSQEEKERLQFAGHLHDIGKIGIPDHILLKPDRLTEQEFQVIKTHPVIGETILRPILHDPLERVIVRNHHERLDGRGYPDGLVGSQIPFLVRIVSVADAFDAMTTPRTYRGPLRLEQAVTELQRCTGTQFDAEIVQAFLRCLPQIWPLNSYHLPRHEE